MNLGEYRALIASEVYSDGYISFHRLEICYWRGVLLDRPAATW